MIERIFSKTIVLSLAIILCLCQGQAYSQDDKNDVGENDPFAQFLMGEKSPDTQKISIAPDIEKPELFLETITLKSVDAKSMKNVITNLSSKYGSISADTKSNSLIICDTAEILDKIIAQIIRADRATVDVNEVQRKPKPALFVETVTLKFLDAQKMKLAIANMSSEYGNIAVDSKRNTLILCDTEENLATMLKQVRKSDKTPDQIMIEVVIIDVKLEDDTEIGVNWDSLFEAKRKQQYTQTFADTLADATAIAGGDFIWSAADISGTLHMLQETRDVEILASPRVLVVSGEEAVIRTVEEIPYREITGSSQGGGGDNALTSTAFKLVGVTLTVKAIVTDDDKILITVAPQQSVVTGESGIENIPIVDTREAATTLIMEDYQVVVMGGLRRKETRITRTQVPILGDLPIIGFFFSNDKKEVVHSELVVLLSPHIYRNEPIAPNVMRKFDEIKNRPLLMLPKQKSQQQELIAILKSEP